MSKRRYKNRLIAGWKARNASRRKYGLELFPEPEYDPLDDMDPSEFEMITIHSTNVRPEYLRHLAMKAGIVIMTDRNIHDLNRMLGERRRETRDFSVLDMVADEEYLEYEDENIRARLRRNVKLFFETLREQPLIHQVPTLHELSIKALSVASNFCEILRLKGENAFRVEECNALKDFLLEEYPSGSEFPKVVSPFAKILSPLNKLLIFKAFYIQDFGDMEGEDVYSDEDTLTTMIDTSHDNKRLLSQMYYLQPNHIIHNEGSAPLSDLLGEAAESDRHYEYVIEWE